MTPEAREAIRKILSAGWLITNQLVYTVAASRRGHTTRLRQVLNSLGVVCYYTFSVKGFGENYTVFTPNSRSMQEQQEEKLFGRMTAEQTAELDAALTGEGDTAYALMISSSIMAVVCNKTACDAIGIDVYSIETLDDFTAACQKAVDAGIVPMVNHKSAGDLAHIAGAFTTYDDALSSNMQAQLDGTWDWEDIMLELDYFSNLIDMGAYWEDRSTMDSTAEIERLANGKSLFYFANNSGYVGQLHDLNPDAEFVMIPFPSVSKTAKRYVAGGEGYAVGINKDTENLDAARAWLTYLSKNGGAVAQSYTGISCISTIPRDESDYGANSAYAMLEKYPNSEYVNIWDREYMPSGMWGVFGVAVGMLYADNSKENLVAIKEFLRENYVEKYAAAHN